MRLDALANKNNWPTYELEKYARERFGDAVKEGMLGASIDDRVAEELEKGFRSFRAKRRKELDEAERKRAGAKVEMKFMTSGYSFDGYRVAEYLGMTSGDIILGTGILSSTLAGFSDMAGMESGAFGQKLFEAKSVAREALAVNAGRLGANALIGVDYDVFEMKGLLGVSANGTAVVIEREQGES